MATKRLMGIDQIVSNSGKVYDIGTLPSSGKIRRLVGVDQVVNSDTGFMIDVDAQGYRITKINGHGEHDYFFCVSGIAGSGTFDQAWQSDNTTKDKGSYITNSTASSFGSLSRSIRIAQGASNGEEGFVAGEHQRGNSGSTWVSNFNNMKFSMFNSADYQSWGSLISGISSYQSISTGSINTSECIAVFGTQTDYLQKTSFESSSLVQDNSIPILHGLRKMQAKNDDMAASIENNIWCNLYSEHKLHLDVASGSLSYSTVSLGNYNTGLTTDGESLFSHSINSSDSYVKINPFSWSSYSSWGRQVSSGREAAVSDSNGTYGIKTGGYSSGAPIKSSDKKLWSSSADASSWGNLVTNRYNHPSCTGG
jgi:hypothetical protein